MYIYIYIEREREKERDVYIYIYIYIYPVLPPELEQWRRSWRRETTQTPKRNSWTTSSNIDILMKLYEF